jgi:hypothetical protein
MVERKAWDCLKRNTVVYIKYSTIKTKGAACIGYYGFLFSGVRMRKKTPVISNTAASFVSIVIYLTYTIRVMLKK